jgi:hypothetical protein
LRAKTLFGATVAPIARPKRMALDGALVEHRQHAGQGDVHAQAWALGSAPKAVLAPEKILTAC